MKENSAGRDGVTCPLLGNKLHKTSCLGTMNNCCLRFRGPDGWAWLSLVCGCRQEAGWCHIISRLGWGPESVSRLTHGLPQAEGLLAVDPTGGLLRCPHSVCQPLPSGPPGRGKREAAVPITTWPQKAHITPSALFCPSGVSPVQSTRKGRESGFILEGRMSEDSWTYFTNPHTNSEV